MKKSSSPKAKAQQKLDPFSNIVFNSVDGFAKDGIVFDGPFKFESDRILAKSVEFPGGVKLGYAALSIFFHNAAIGTLRSIKCMMVDNGSAWDEETKIYYGKLFSVSIRSLYIAEMLDGKVNQQALDSSVKFLNENGIFFNKKMIEKTLRSDFFAV